MRILLIYLASLEFTLAIAAFYAGAYLRFGGDLESEGESVLSLAPQAMLFSLLLLTALVSVGMYRARNRMRFSEVAVRLATAFPLAAIGGATLSYMIPTLSTGRGLLVLGLLISFPALAVTRVVFNRFSHSDRFKRNVLVYGHGPSAAALSRLCEVFGHNTFRLVGYLGVHGKNGSPACVPLLQRGESLLQVTRDHEVDEIVIAMDELRNNFPARELLDCRVQGVRVSEALSFIEKETGQIDLRSLRPSWLIFGSGFRQGFVQTALKRLFDLCAALSLLAVTWPLMAIATFAILVESRGKGGVLYRQERVGFRGAVFPMLKLRSMVPDAEGDGHAQWAAKNDPRVTRVGTLIRRFRIDELPQIINILRGEMSFVGPRPERPEFVRELCKQIPFYAERHCVKPGLAGWAQISYPYGSSVADAKHKLQYDLFYVKNHNLALDLLILIETLEIVLWGKARHVKLDDEQVDVNSDLARAAGFRSEPAESDLANTA